MIPAIAPDAAVITFEHFMLRRVMSGTSGHAAFHFDARSDGRVMFSVSGRDWTAAGSATSLSAAQHAVEAAIRSRQQASGDPAARIGGAQQ